MKLNTLDKQFDEIPKEVIYCKNCVVSNQRPRTKFNSEGICSACQWAYEKDYKIDWEKREYELVSLLDKYRSKTGDFDVIVPGSGGKDSTYVAHQLKYKYGMNPLCVTWAPFEFSEIGWKNLQNFIRSGFNNTLVHPDGKLHKKLAKLCFELKGDPFEPFAYGQKALAFHFATKYNISLIFYGENGELEYGGSEKYKYLPKEGPEEWEYQYYKGAGVDKLIEIGLQNKIITKSEVTPSQLIYYKAPPIDIIKKANLEMHWFSYYKKWVPQENFYYAATYTGFETNHFGRSEGTYTKYASLDDKLDGFHFYLSYIKFGLGRASRDAQQDIRRHHITREEGVALVNRFDGEFPQRYFNWFLDYLEISKNEFWSVIDRYRELSNVWKKNEKGEWIMPYKVK